MTPPPRRPPSRAPRAIIAADVPLALLPVRLETRFVSIARGVELLIRIYPDDVHTDTHEEDLTANEVMWSLRFAEAIASAGGDDEARKQAWAELLRRAGPERAAWIAKQAASGAAAGGPAAPGTWTRAAHTRVLPDRWVALGYTHGQSQPVFEQTGADIPDPLPNGPDPAADIPGVANDQLAIDQGARWLVDFDEAVRVGMGLRVKLRPNEARHGVDTLLVLGVKASLEPAAAAERLSGLIDAHHYTGGVAFVPVGTPTNNSADAASGVSRQRDPVRSYDTELGNPLCQRGDGSNGDVMARAFGIDPQTFGHVEHADRRDDADARHMNTALWPATWGYFLDQMIAGPGQRFSTETLNQTRRHFIDHVRARGPLPTLRFGNQPYGILPVASLDDWGPSAASAVEREIARLVRVFRDVWRRSLSAAPRIGRTADPDQDLLEVLGMEPTSSSYVARAMVGGEYLRELWRLMGSDLDAIWSRYEPFVQSVLGQLGMDWKPRLVRSFFMPQTLPLSAPLVQAGPGTALSPNYIEWLQSNDYQVIRDELNLDPKPQAMLYVLLRHAILLTHASAALSVQSARGMATDADRFEPEMVDVTRDGETVTPWNRLETPIRIGPREMTIGSFLRDPSGRAEAAELGALQEALGAIARHPVDVLERLTAETLDLSSHRLDAWITSLATARLAALRARAPSGIRLGGYGWVEDLRPAPPMEAVTPPAGENGPLFRSKQNAGFIHAPSLAHAVTAAVLRSGHLSHARDANAPLEIDLSSARVRLALWLLDGVRQGQPLGALLGYRFERSLQDRGLDRHIQTFRRFAPLVANKLEPADQPLESVAASNVVDGLALHRRWKAPDTPWTTLNLPQPSAPELDALNAARQDLDDVIDAVGDAMVAEGVYQAVQGNTSRSGGALDAISRGDAPPLELEVARTPRSGLPLTHRLLVLLDEAFTQTTAWPGHDTPRADAEPRLNAWVATLLGDPRRFKCRGIFVYQPPGGGRERERSVEIELPALKLSPIDVLYIAEGGGRAQRAELEQRLAYYLRRYRRPADVPPDAQIRLLFGREALRDNEASFVELLEMARAARALITGARPASARDLSPPDRGVADGYDAPDLAARADTAARQLQEALTAIEAATIGRDTSPLDPLRDALLRVAAFGVPGSVPSTAENDAADRQALLEQAETARRECGRRLAALAKIREARTTPGGPDPETQPRYHLDRLREIFGAAFCALPMFRASNAPEVNAAFAANGALDGGPRWPVVSWFQRVTRVREGAARLSKVLTYGEAQRTGLRLNLRVAQIPFTDPTEPWLALELRNGVSRDALGGRVSVVAQLSREVDVAQPICGLAVDEWVEVIPSQTELTGVAFHFDEPGARAPQAILLAVPCDDRSDWDVESLASVALQTLELAKLRTLDLDALREGGHFLPGLYFGYNAAGATVTSDLTRLAKPPL